MFTFLAFNWLFNLPYLLQEIHEGYDLSTEDDGGYTFGIFSVKFSSDGREIVAGSSDDAIYVQDIEANRRTLRISAHRVGMNNETRYNLSLFPLTLLSCL